MKIAKTTALIGLVLASAACSRIETGSVGIVRQFDKEISLDEKLPGSFTQTITQTLIQAQTKDIPVDVQNLKPLAADNSTIDDYDLQVIYSIKPSMAAELYKDKSSSFHAYNKEDDLFLMYNYVYQVARNSAYKAARKFKSLELNDNRTAMESDIIEAMNATFNEDKELQGAVVVSQVLIRNVQPAAAILQSANDFIRAQNEYKKKEVEVETAKKEAERISALNANKGAIEYMNAQANMLIAQGVADGKVNTIVVPYDFKGIVNAK